MSQSNVSGWLPNLIGPVQIQNPAGTAVTSRPAIRFMGCTFTDDGSATIITPNAQSSLAADGTGFVSITTTKGIKHVSAKAIDTDFDLAATTPDATFATILTYTAASNRRVSIDGIVTLWNGGTGISKYKLDVIAHNVSGTLTIRQATITTDFESTSPQDMQVIASGVDILIQGKGFSSNNSWTGRIFVHEAQF